MSLTKEVLEKYLKDVKEFAKEFLTTTEVGKRAALRRKEFIAASKACSEMCHIAYPGPKDYLSPEVTPSEECFNVCMDYLARLKKGTPDEGMKEFIKWLQENNAQNVDTIKAAAQAAGLLSSA